MIRYAVVILFMTFLFIESCSQGYIVNMNESTRYPEGRKLFISKCNGCHQLYNPGNFNAAEWDSILIPMQKKAKLDNTQRNAIYQWILEIKANKNKSARLD